MSKVELSRRAALAGLAASPAAMAFLRGAIAEAQTSLSQSGLVGEIQGPTMITDPAKWPTRFSDAPMLAELVKAGKLPPVEQRIPAEPMVWQPLNEIGADRPSLRSLRSAHGSDCDQHVHVALVKFL